MADTPSKHILIAEDEKPLAHALESKLTHAGFSVIVTYNGSEVLDILKKGDVDLLLLDLVMPEADGFTVLEQMKKDGTTIPTIVLSNLSQPEDEKKVRELGAQDFFIKSNIQLADVVTKVKSILE